MKKKTIALLSALCCLTATTFGQAMNPDHDQAYQVVQGTGVYDDSMIKLMSGLRDLVWGEWGTFIDDAKALSAIFMLIFFAIRSYEMMVGDKNLEIMPLLRPFGLSMVILWWSVFVKVIAFPGQVVEVKTFTKWQEMQSSVDDLRLERADLMKTMADSLYSFQAQTQLAEKESDTWYGQAWDAVSSTVKQGIANVITPILDMKARLQISIQLLMTQMLEIIALWILRVAVYAIFLIQAIYSGILVILGPFAVAVSILPAFRDSFSTWIARFVSVSLYSGIAYLVLWFNGVVQQYAMQAEISRYQGLLGGSNKMLQLAALSSNGLLSFGTVIISFLIAAICMFTVPSISTWIISTSGISSAVSTVGRASSGVGRTLAKAGSFL